MSLIKKIMLIFSVFFVVSCSSNCNNSPNDQSSSLKLSISAPSEYPSGIASLVPVVVQNIDNQTAKNISYTITNNTTGVNLSITEQSMQNCMTLSPSQMCSLYVSIPVGSKPGSFAVKASASVSNKQQSNSLTKLSSNMNSTVYTTVGLTTLLSNTESGINGVLELNTNSVSLPNESSGVVVVTFVVVSPNSGVFNTIDLVDAQHNTIPYQVLSNNSGNGFTALSNGDIVSLAVNIPSGATQLSFYPALKMNGTIIQNGLSATPTTILVLRPSSAKVGVLNTLPSDFVLNESNTEQVITVYNNGNGKASDLSVLVTSPAIIDNGSSTCGDTLESNATCTYTVKFDAQHSHNSGTGGFVINYNSGLLSSSDTSTFEYSGDVPVVGLTITSENNPNFNFKTTTNNPSVSSLITLTNTGEVSLESFAYNLPAGFTTSTSMVSNACTTMMILQPNQSCNIALIYNNGTVKSSTTESIAVVYHYVSLDDAVTVLSGSSTILATSQTIQSQSILSVATSTVNFGNLLNNNFESLTQTITVTNIGDEPINSSINLSLATPSTVYAIQSNTCNPPILAGGSCTVTLSAGPVVSSMQAGPQNNVLNITYRPVSSSQATNTTNVNLSTQIVTAQTAIINVAQTSKVGFTGGSGESSGNSAMLESGVNGSVVYTITNTGLVDANNFTISNDANSLLPWVKTNNCPATLIAGGSCTVTYSLNNSTVGTHNLSMSNINMSWMDQDSPTGQTQVFNTSSFYENTFAPAKIIFSSESINMSVGGTSTVTATLVGGYSVADQNISVFNNTGGAISSIVESPSPCVLNSNSTACTITFVASNSAVVGAYSVGLANAGSLSIPSTIGVTISQPVWQYLPNSINISGVGVFGTLQQPQLLFNNGTLYIAYVSSTSYKITVKRLDSGVWSTVGNGEFAVGNSGYEFDRNSFDNSLYVLQRNGMNSLQLWKFNSILDLWESVGAALTPVSGASYTGAGSVAFSSLDGHPYVAYLNNNSSNTLKMVEFINGSWSTVATSNSPTSQNPIRLMIDSNNKKYVLRASSTGYEIVMEDSGGFVNPVSITSKNGVSYFPSAQMGSDNYIYVAYSNASASDKVSVIRYNGTNTEDIGGFLTSVGVYANTAVSLSLDEQNVPYVAYVPTVGLGQPKAYVSKYSNGSWVQMGNQIYVANLNSKFGIYGLAVSQSTKYPYVSYLDASRAGASGASIVYYPSSN